MRPRFSGLSNQARSSVCGAKRGCALSLAVNQWTPRTSLRGLGECGHQTSSAIGLVWSVHPGGVDNVTGQVDVAVVDQGQDDGHSFCHVVHPLCKFGWHLVQDRVGELAEASAEA